MSNRSLIVRAARQKNPRRVAVAVLNWVIDGSPRLGWMCAMSLIVGFGILYSLEDTILAAVVKTPPADQEAVRRFLEAWVRR